MVSSKDEKGPEVNYVEYATPTQTAEQELTLEERFPNIDKKKLLRKLDWKLLPTLSVLYLMSFLDRGNIGNAKIEGMPDDIGLKGNQYNLTLTIFFITYFLFEVPSNIILKKYSKPSVWLPTIMIAWGIVMTLMGIVHNFGGLFATRLFLGVTEAGLFPGVTFYLTMWYPAENLQLRQALFFSAASIAGAFSGLLAFGLAKMDGVGGLEGWRWIFLIEGILTVVIAVGAFFTLFDYPDTANFLSEEEKEYISASLTYSRKAMKDKNGKTVNFAQDNGNHHIKSALLDWQVYTHLIQYWACLTPLYGLSLFLPSIIRDFGYTSAKAQLLTVPIYATAAIFSVVVSWFADHWGKKAPILLGSYLIMIVGYVIAIAAPATAPGVGYAGVFIAALGIYPSIPCAVSWLANNIQGPMKRSVAMAIQIGLGNLGGAFASNFYRAKDAPHYKLGHGMEIMFIGLGVIAAIINFLAYTIINRRRDADLNSGKHDELTAEELSQLGDKAPTFRYIL
ncbi:MFS general substrate transporter [Nadsonia fulvescens var. elongata DSM 6958]|uniref:MFS general substrate transporter n=1 Tax=Nadsonia fulvescens var. elongata DSM 6958 TaxID=857566 RepID=A0A1E3PD75_9ASCO|nr:MFS general substrate transporter [Nadsonia fulvescens var. elongata DSM 6958]